MEIGSSQTCGLDYRFADVLFGALRLVEEVPKQELACCVACLRRYFAPMHRLFEVLWKSLLRLLAAAVP